MTRDHRCGTCDGYGYVTGHPSDGYPQSPCPDCVGGWHR